jgi:energy-coupling factor transporter ATP-binding protein EcfA2
LFPFFKTKEEEQELNNPSDVAFAKLPEIEKSFSDFIASKGRVSETDTRIKLIDRILKEVCFWPESQVSREDHVDSGRTDYQLLVRGAPHLVVEAKREGESFILPLGAAYRSPKLNGILSTSTNVNLAIDQVRKYCDDAGIRFAIATNGYSWIIFRAIRDDMPWKNGRAHIFPSLEYIQEHFIDFWNLLSYDAICTGSLDVEFGRSPASSRNLYRVIDHLFNADLPLQRNRLNFQLQPLVKAVFEDITAQGDIDLLQSCYVHTGSLKVILDDLGIVITDTIPKNIEFQGTKPIIQSSTDAGDFGSDIEQKIAERKGELYLLLGGIGSGKTTFLRRFQQIIAKPSLDKNAYVFALDFLQAPLAASEMEVYVWKTLLDIVRTNYAEHGIEERRNVKAVFKDKLRNLSTTAFRKIKPHTEEFEVAIGPYLLEWQNDVADYVPKLLRLACAVNNKTSIIFIDNVDQLDPEYQSQVFLLAQRVTRLSGTVTIVALREESYYARSIQNTFTAYTSHRFHIASPHFRPMVQNRIEYAIRILERGEGILSKSILVGISRHFQLKIRESM